MHCMTIYDYLDVVIFREQIKNWNLIIGKFIAAICELNAIFNPGKLATLAPHEAVTGPLKIPSLKNQSPANVGLTLQADTQGNFVIAGCRPQAVNQDVAFVS
jgi:hypothetical protein